jgi:hypothetical protein
MNKHPLLSPQVTKAFNRITYNFSIPKNDIRKNRIYSGFNHYKNNYTFLMTKYESNTPEYYRKKNSMTFNSDDNYKIANINIERILKRNKNRDKSNDKKQNKKISNKNELNKNTHHNKYRQQSSYISHLTNYSSNLRKMIKNIKKNNNYNPSTKVESSTSITNNTDGLKTKNKQNRNHYESNDNSNNIKNNEFLDIINIKQNDNFTMSRNKKHSHNKGLNTQSQNDFTSKDSHIKTIKNLKSNCVDSKNQIKNMTSTNDSNVNIPKYFYYNFSKFNSSIDLKNVQTKEVVSKKINISQQKRKKKKPLNISQDHNKNNNFYLKQARNLKKKELKIGKIIPCSKKSSDIKPNSKYNKITNKKNNYNNIISNNTVANLNNGNFIQIINVNRNIRLINRTEDKTKK